MHVAAEIQGPAGNGVVMLIGGLSFVFQEGSKEAKTSCTRRRNESKEENTHGA